MRPPAVGSGAAAFAPAFAFFFRTPPSAAPKFCAAPRSRWVELIPVQLNFALSTPLCALQHALSRGGKPRKLCNDTVGPQAWNQWGLNRCWVWWSSR